MKQPNKLVALKDCCEIVSGSTPRRSEPTFWNGDIPWVTPKDLSSLGGNKILDTELEHITQEGFESCSTQMLPARSVLFSSRAPIGLVAITAEPVCTNQGFKSLVPSPTVDADYLYWVLVHFRPRIQDLGTGSTFKEVSKRVFGGFEIPLPPIQEQRRIAAILDKADEISRKRQQAIELTDELLRSVFLDMFGDPMANPKGWTMSTIGEECDVMTGNTPPRSDLENYGGQVEWIKSQNILGRSGEISEAVETLSDQGAHRGRVVEAGAVLVVCIAGSRSSIGRTGILSRRAAFNQQINALMPRQGRVESAFIWGLINAYPELVRQASTGGMKGLVSKSSMQALPIPVPPIESQVTYSDAFKNILRLRRRAVEATEASEELFGSLA